MSTKGTKRASYRLSDDLRQKLRLIGEDRGGLDESSMFRVLISEEWDRRSKKILKKAQAVS